MGLVVVVVRILAKDHNFDGVEGGVAGPECVEYLQSKELR